MDLIIEKQFGLGWDVGFHSDSALVVGMNFGSPASTCTSSRISVQPNLQTIGGQCPPYMDLWDFYGGAIPAVA